MHLSDIQNILKQFHTERGWNKFSASLVMTHLLEELGELSDYILIEEGYKATGLGHDGPEKNQIEREFAQVLSLFVQLANHFDVDLENSFSAEFEIMQERFPADKWAEYMNRF